MHGRTCGGNAVLGGGFAGKNSAGGDSEGGEMLGVEFGCVESDHERDHMVEYDCLGESSAVDGFESDSAY